MKSEDVSKKVPVITLEQIREWVAEVIDGEVAKGEFLKK